MAAAGGMGTVMAVMPNWQTAIRHSVDSILAEVDAKVSDVAAENERLRAENERLRHALEASEATSWRTDASNQAMAILDWLDNGPITPAERELIEAALAWAPAFDHWRINGVVKDEERYIDQSRTLLAAADAVLAERERTDG